MTREKCVFCGNNPAQVSIRDPNQPLDEFPSKYWEVCVPCKKLIPLMHLHAVAEASGNKRMSAYFKNKIDQISAEDGQPYCIAVIKKKESA